MSERCPSIFAVDIKLVWWSWLSQIQPISPVSPLLPISPHTLLTVHGTSSYTKHTEVRKPLLKPELKSRLRPLSFWDLQVVFLSARPSCCTGAISYPPPLHCPVWSWSCRDRRKKSEGGLESFVWVFLHLGIYQKKRLWLPLQSKLSLKAAGHRAHLAQLARAANLSLPQQSAAPAAPRGVYLTCL